MIKSNINDHSIDKNNNWLIKTTYIDNSVCGQESVTKKQIIVHIGLSSFFILLSLVLKWAAINVNGFADWYSGKIYPFWQSTLGRVSSLYHFSVLELMLLVIIGYMTLNVFGFVIHIVIKKQEDISKCNSIMQFRYPKCMIKSLRVLLLVSMLFLIFTLNAGINYYRNTLSEYLGIKQQEYSVDDLQRLCMKLTNDVNQWSNEIDRNDQGLFTVGTNANKRAVEAMHAVGKKNDILAGYYPNPKPLLFSWILSYEHISGIFTPFTMEANYNKDIVPYNIPFTMCHELSHTKGFMREDEANFIAYLACISTDNPELQYSGSLMSWIYSTNLLYSIDAKAYQEVRSQLNQEVLLDLKENSQFWNKHKGTVSKLSKKVNNTYLNANGQSDGIKSYNRMVDLLIAYYRE